MYAIPLNSIIADQYTNIDRDVKWLKLSVKLLPRFVLRFWQMRWLLKSFYNLSFQIKGLHKYIADNFDNIKGRDLNDVIAVSNRLVAHLSKVKGELESIDSEEKQRYSKIQLAEAAIIESLDDTYQMLRLLRRANKAVEGTTSDLARSTSHVSRRTLEKVLNGN
ncbi:hypothetical protein [Parafilimonas terrae]|jgi:hypothetical protein|uniref:Uncharacterized protein n=1 Tax=Parafilimonas terrae TaxID=1465490 RepID=A0A1I5V3X8_9BACT|nr:hypothetical protein [Parafilimonas terrae]SFQ01676.1 hypothetical protein SAMN05444277_104169 [Parafilimonas terrae]